MSVFGKVGFCVVLGSVGIGVADAAAPVLPPAAATWTGIWEPAVGGTDSAFDPGGTQLPADPKAAAALIADMTPPFSPAWKSEYQKALANIDHVDPRPNCSHGSLYGQLTGAPIPFEILVTPQETAFVYSGGVARRIYTDGQGHLSPRERWPVPFGDSVGEWRGNSLSIDTVSAKPEVFIEVLQPGQASKGLVMKLSEQMRYEEHWKMLPSGELENRLSIIDPVALDKPWSRTLRFRRVKGMRHVLDEDCLENDRNPIVDGQYTFKQ